MLVNYLKEPKEKRNNIDVNSSNQIGFNFAYIFYISYFNLLNYYFILFNALVGSIFVIKKIFRDEMYVKKSALFYSFF